MVIFWSAVGLVCQSDEALKTRQGVSIALVIVTMITVGTFPVILDMIR